MPTASIAGQPLHYRDSGQGFPLLLGHSFLWSAAMWDRQIAVLSQRYRVIVPDLWGHGQSGPLPADTGDVQDLAKQMLELLDRLQISECAVIGLSVGGMWGAELALRAPHRVRGLVMMDTFLGAEPQATRQRYFGMLDAIEAGGQISPALVEAIVPIFFRPGIDLSGPLPTTFASTLTAWPTDRLRQSVVPLGRLIFGRADAMDRLGALPAERTFLLSGAEDIPRPPAETLQMAERIGCDAVLVPDAGHISCLENPDFVNTQLESWLGRHFG